VQRTDTVCRKIKVPNIRGAAHRHRLSILKPKFLYLYYFNFFKQSFSIMANTFTQLYVQIIFAPKGREKMIPKKHKEDIHRYITGIIRDKERKHKLLAINCIPDHIHIL